MSQIRELGSDPNREVEEALYRHPDVAEAAVIGLPDPKWIELVTAVVVLRELKEMFAPVN